MRDETKIPDVTTAEFDAELTKLNAAMKSDREADATAALIAIVLYRQAKDIVTASGARVQDMGQDIVTSIVAALNSHFTGSDGRCEPISIIRVLALVQLRYSAALLEGVKRKIIPGDKTVDDPLEV